MFSHGLQVSHMGDWMRVFGSLVPHSTQALEHLHALHKAIRSLMGRSVTAARDCMRADSLCIARRLATVRSWFVRTPEPVASVASESEDDERED